MRRLLITAGVLLVLLTGQAHPFGKNKINYYTYDWTVLTTKHFKIYLTTNELPISNLIISTMESIYTNHTNTTGYKPPERIKVVLYPNQIDFQQNNIISDWLTEATGGFTEFIKGRVVLPYSGDYPYFYHVLSHELTHAFQGTIWGDGVLSIAAIRDVDIPLWLVEGGAEFNSIGLDMECEMMIADGIINGTLPTLEELSDLYTLDVGDYMFVYKEGQIFYYYINEIYGENIFAEINDAISDLRETSLVFDEVFGKTFEEMDAEFMDYLRKRYQPDVAHLLNIDIAADRLIETEDYYDMNPIYIDSNRVAFITGRFNYPYIAVYDKDDERIYKLIRGGITEDYLEFHYGMRNHLSVSTNGTLCFVTRSGGDDVIHLYHTTSKEEQTLALPFRLINSPEINRAGNKICLSGYAEHQYDIYIYDINSEELTRITEDSYMENQPRWLDETHLVFTANSRAGADSGDSDIVIYDLTAGKVETLIDSGYEDSYPAIAPGTNLIAFIRNDLHPNLMFYRRDTGELFEELDTTGGVFSPSFGSDTNVVLIAFHRNRYNLFEYTVQLTNRVTNALITNLSVTTPEPVFDSAGLLTNKSFYKPEFSIDTLLGAFTINTSLGMALVGLLGVSDILGNHRFQLLMDSILEVQESFWDYFNVDLTYYYLKNRWDVGVRLFNYSNYFYEFSTFQSFVEMEETYKRSWGAYGLFSYPFDTFNRIDITGGVRGFKFLESRELVGTNYVYQYSTQNRPFIRASFIHDSTLSDYTGPIDGTRFEVLTEMSYSIFTNSISYQKFVIDFRHYIYIYEGYSIAFRTVAGKMFGTDKVDVPFYIGGFNSIRGHELWYYSGDSMFLVNFEFRFPMLISWQLGFPLPINMPTLWGAIYWDMGSVVNWGDVYQPFLYEGENLLFNDLIVGVGFGLRIVLLPEIKLMVDFATPYYGMGLPSLDQWNVFWQIGVDF